MTRMIIKPRRGNKSVMQTTEKSSLVLADGEMFVEFDDDEPDIKKRHARVKIGNAGLTYDQLPYAWGNNSEDEEIDFIEDHRTAFQIVFADFVTGITLSKMIPLIKRCLYLLDTAVTTLESNVYKKSEVYTKTQSNNRYPLKTDVYTKSEIDNTYYTRTVTDAKLLVIDNKFVNYYDTTYINSHYYDKENTMSRTEIANDIYSKQEIRNIGGNESSDDVLQHYYTKSYIDANYSTDQQLRNQYYTQGEIDGKFNNYYTKQEIYDLFVDFNQSINSMLRSNFYDQTYINNNYYTQTQCNTRFEPKH